MPDPNAALPSGLPRTTIVLGVLGVVLAALYLFTGLGAVTLYAAITAGLSSVVVGIIALRQREFVGFAVAGIALGAVAAIVGVGILVFALLFVGAIG